MQDSLFRYLEGSRQAVRYWWLLLAGGVILFLIGVVHLTTNLVNCDEQIRLTELVSVQTVFEVTYRADSK